MIAIYFEDHKESVTFDMTNEWLAENGINVAGFFVSANEDAAEVAKKYELTTFPVIFSMGGVDKEGKEIFIKYAEGLDAIKALTPDIIEQIKADIVLPVIE